MYRFRVPGGRRRETLPFLRNTAAAEGVNSAEDGADVWLCSLRPYSRCRCRRCDGRRCNVWCFRARGTATGRCDPANRQQHDRSRRRNGVRAAFAGGVACDRHAAGIVYLRRAVFVQLRRRPVAASVLPRRVRLQTRSWLSVGHDGSFRPCFRRRGRPQRERRIFGRAGDTGTARRLANDRRGRVRSGRPGKRAARVDQRADHAHGQWQRPSPGPRRARRFSRPRDRRSRRPLAGRGRKQHGVADPPGDQGQGAAASVFAPGCWDGSG